MNGSFATSRLEDRCHYEVSIRKVLLNYMQAKLTCYSAIMVHLYSAFIQAFFTEIVHHIHLFTDTLMAEET